MLSADRMVSRGAAPATRTMSACHIWLASLIVRSALTMLPMPSGALNHVDVSFTRYWVLLTRIHSRRSNRQPGVHSVVVTVWWLDVCCSMRLPAQHPWTQQIASFSHGDAVKSPF